MAKGESATWSERLGTVIGWLWAPWTGAGSLVRRARFLHPEGAVYRCDVEAVPSTRHPDAAGRLAGPGLARMSTAWWRHGRELPDALGLALRLRRRGDAAADAQPGDQDLLLATIRHPLTTLLAPLTTHVHDFLDNDYYGVSPFIVDGVGRAWLRARSVGPSRDGVDRGDRLARAVARGGARFVLELQHGRGQPWEPLATVTLVEPIDVDQERLRFSPFHAGRGVAPTGFVQALRRATYALSQTARPARAR